MIIHITYIHDNIFLNKSGLITKFYTAINCQWGEWEIGECSVECGYGTRVKTREKVVEEEYGGTCTGDFTENENCKDKECPGPGK